MATAKELRALLPGWFTVAEVADLPAKNVFTVVFAGTKTIQSPRGAEEKPVLMFAEGVKGLVLSKSRADQLAALFGDDALEGNRIRLAIEPLNGRDTIAVLSPKD